MTLSTSSPALLVFVDYNRSNGKILVTTERGIVIVCNENGGHLNSFSGNGNIAMARWQGNDVFIQNRNGSCELRSQNGGWIRGLKTFYALLMIFQFVIN